MFKVPEHPITSITSKSKNTETCTSNTDVSTTDGSTDRNITNLNVGDNASKSGTVLSPIPYTEPSWGGLPDVLYSLEELKQGVSLRTILLDRSFHCFGRFNNCHVVMAHPSISRYHAILQFRSTFSPTDEKKGFYIIDLGSTHGTFVNKERILPKTFVKLQVGHIIKFGSSTRMFLLHGPDYDQEKESEYSYNQLRDLKKRQLEEREKAYLEETAKLCKTNDAGVDWGMGEDADEESDLSENPFAVTNNEELYIEDPKKTLRGWFEREGEELSYNVEEKGFGHFRCTIELPIEGNGGLPVVAEATVSGKKKEAIHQCALEACRILDRNGLLRQAVHESKQRKRKNWEENDFYDSDEDSFFDRTGELEAKRKQRMVRTGKEQPVVDTYDTLVAKHSNVLQEIKETENKLNRMMNNNNDPEDEDYMKCNFNERVDKLKYRTLEMTLMKLQQDRDNLVKLIDFTKPYNLPQIKSTMAGRVDSLLTTSDLHESNFTSEMVQKDIVKTDTCLNDSNVVKENQTNEVFKVPNSGVRLKSKNSTDKNNKTNDSLQEENVSEIGLPLFSDIEQKTEQNNQQKKETISKKKSHPMLAKKITKLESTNNSEHYSNLIWKPPIDQTGDGRTSLNDKFGY